MRHRPTRYSRSSGQGPPKDDRSLTRGSLPPMQLTAKLDVPGGRSAAVDTVPGRSLRLRIWSG